MAGSIGSTAGFSVSSMVVAASAWCLRGANLGIMVTSSVLAREVLREQDHIFSGYDILNVVRSISYGDGST